VKRIQAVVFALFVLGVFSAPVFFAENKSSTGGKNPLPPFYLAETQGKVFLISWDTTAKKAVKAKAKAPRAVRANDRIVTEKDSRAYFQFKDGGTLEVGPKSDVFVREIDVDPKTFRARFLLTYGRVKATVKKMTGARSTFEVEAGGVVAGVRGTTFGVTHDPEGNKTVTQTYEGTIFARSGGTERWVKEGFSLALSGNQAVAKALASDELKDFSAFLGAAGNLEKKKKSLLQQLEKQLLKNVTNETLKQGMAEGKKALDLGF